MFKLTSKFSIFLLIPLFFSCNKEEEPVSALPPPVQCEQKIDRTFYDKPVSGITGTWVKVQAVEEYLRSELSYSDNFELEIIANFDGTYRVTVDGQAQGGYNQYYEIAGFQYSLHMEDAPESVRYRSFVFHQRGALLHVSFSSLAGASIKIDEFIMAKKEYTTCENVKLDFITETSADNIPAGQWEIFYSDLIQYDDPFLEISATGACGAVFEQFYTDGCLAMQDFESTPEHTTYDYYSSTASVAQNFQFDHILDYLVFATRAGFTDPNGQSYHFKFFLKKAE